MNITINMNFCRYFLIFLIQPKIWDAFRNHRQVIENISNYPVPFYDYIDNVYNKNDYILTVR